MGRHLWIALLGISCTPLAAEAIELHWVGGATDLTATSATVCTLWVTPSASELTLPAAWRVLWVGESAGDSGLVFRDTGVPDASPICAFSGPTTEADALSHTITIDFCGDGDAQPGTRVAYVVEVPAMFHGRIAALPLNNYAHLTPGGAQPSEVTVNGGTSAAFPPHVLTVTQFEDSTGTPTAGITGVGLDQITSVTLASGAASARKGTRSAATSESFPITYQTPTALAVQLPGSLDGTQSLVLGNGAGEPTAGATPDGTESEQLVGFRMFPPFPYRAKDFAFIRASGQFHLFYIRENLGIVSESDSNAIDLGHAVSTNLMNWTHLPPVMHTRADKWDNLHVWAPSIVERSGTHYMFYTGVTKVPFNYEWFQRLGVATSTDPTLTQWTRGDAPLYSCYQVPWTTCDSSQFSGSQFRDPFVMAHPEQPNQWLMNFVASPSNLTPTNLQIVGAAQSGSLTAQWADLKPMLNTDGTGRFLGYCESPHQFHFNGLWYLFFTTNAGRPITYETAASPVADSSGWSGHQRLYFMAGAEAEDTNAWFASEHLEHQSHHYFAAANSRNNAIEIREMIPGVAPNFSFGTPVVAVEDAPRPPDPVALAYAGRDGQGQVLLRVVLPTQGRVTIDLFDVLGRRTARAIDRVAPGGETLVSWDGRDRQGRPVASGVYFARLRANGETRSARVAIVH